MPLFTEKEIRTKAKKTNINPTEAQTAAGNYKKATIPWNGLTLKIENPRGSTRSGTGPGGKKWSNTMRHHYGYITRTNGYDGDPVDVFIGPYPKSKKVFIVNQVNKNGSFDEHKCMIGFNTKDAAKKGYLANYERGWTGLKNIIEVPLKEFKTWARTKGKKNGPRVGAYKIATIIKLAGKMKMSFSVPENFDMERVLRKRVELWVGGNDWEPNFSSVAIIETDYKGGQERAWITYGIPKEYEDDVDTTKYTDKMRTITNKWIKIAEDTAKKEDRSIGIQHYVDAAKDPAIAKYVERSGKDHTEWKSNKEAALLKIADITLDIDEGDIVLTGRYKNKRREVKSIGTDELGQPTVNKQKLLALRIEKTMPEDRKSSKTQALNKEAFMAGYLA